jgi:hypothetical protein
MKFLGPGSRNAAGLFLKKLNEKLKDHAAGSLARSRTTLLAVIQDML